MNSDASPERRDDSKAFDLLHDKVRRWIWREQWSELRDAQEEAIKAILLESTDVLISAPTAAGKTEAAFLPICSSLVDDEHEGFRALYVSPLKALINDQYERLCDLFSVAEIPVHRWHGDVSSAKKQKAWSSPSGVLLITPESLEALFVLRGHQLEKVFTNLSYVVLDEVHAYIGSARGQQLLSLLCRLDQVVGRRARRIGLSATLGDMSLAAEYLNSDSPDEVHLITSEADGQELQLQLRGYRRRKPDAHPQPIADQDLTTGSDIEDISHHIYRNLRGSSNLVFANSRQRVETFADYLRRLCERSRTPNEFFPHHGNLSKELRELVEDRLKEGSRPTTAVCTSTLELGIDIGQVTSVAQIGPPFSVASTRQRLGRSGRRGEPAVLRMYIAEPELSDLSSIADGLHFDLVQSIAIVALLARRWCEPPMGSRLHLSTLVHQVLSLVAQHGGVSATMAWDQLCRRGAFRNVTKARFAEVLRDMGAADLLCQSPDGTILHGQVGERILNHFSFYAVFETPEEFRIVHQGHTLGSMSIDHGLVEGGFIIFGGRRWRVIGVEASEKRIDVVPGPAGRPPQFEAGFGGLVHDEIRRNMQQVLEGADMPAYLDSEARSLLGEARTNYATLQLRERKILENGRESLVFLFRGDRICNTIAVLLLEHGTQVTIRGPVLTIHHQSEREVRQLLKRLVESEPDPELSARAVQNKRLEKYDWALGETQLCAQYASRALDIPSALAAVRALIT
jgi:ATP-dependent helicase Lhr and Lhr-like helicase